MRRIGAGTGRARFAGWAAAWADTAVSGKKLNGSEAVARDPLFSAAWKALAKALTDIDSLDEALSTYRQGIEAAQKKGDRQAEKEMTVFARRLEKRLGEKKA